MITYRYIARDFTGEVKEGLTKAMSETDVLGWLREQGCTPVSVDIVSTGVARRGKLSPIRRIRSAELAAVFWQLTTMVEGGITIADALDGIAEDIENRKLQKILYRILARIEQGGTFSEGMTEFPKVFSQLVYALILAGETGGDIGAAFRRAAEYFTSRDRLARKVKKALAYPAFVVCFVIFVVVIIMTLIIPRFREMFDQFGAGQLPAFTQAFMAVNDVLVNNAPYVVGGLVLAVILAVWAYRHIRSVHYLCSRIVLSVPLFGTLLKQAFIAGFCRTMANLLRGGVAVLDVFDIVEEMTGNEVISDVLKRTRADIVGGSPIYLSMAGTRFFPNMVTKMVKAGEESGSLWQVLERTADYYEEKVDATITTITGLLEPLLIITVGAIVLVVVLALYMPIFQLSDLRAG
ncbi:MAG TPA: type II secretion system F family protein [Sedimentisphaerales bacterium]|nr:type II secretion system F family protein [Sedimentisphaerales bacterium]